jgi:hypothetical protein
MSVKAVVDVAMAIAETVRELGEVPSGTLYASVMTMGLSLKEYEGVLNVLTRAGLVSKDGNHLIRWVGPKV